jgi:hypothetical protein
VKYVAAVNWASCPEAIFEHFMACREYLEQVVVYITISVVYFQRRKVKLLFPYVLAASYKIQETNCLDKKTIINIASCVFHVEIFKRKTLFCFTQFVLVRDKFRFCKPTIFYLKTATNG